MAEWWLNLFRLVVVAGTMNLEGYCKLQEK